VTKCFTLSLKRVISKVNLQQDLRKIKKSVSTHQLMLSDWKKIDFDYINQYVSWFCQWQPGFISALEKDVHNMLKSNADVAVWRLWLEDLTKRSFGFDLSSLNSTSMMFDDKVPIDLMGFDCHGKQFATKMGFFFGQILRELTIKDARSLDKWYTLWLYLHEEMWYCVQSYLTQLKMLIFGKMSGQTYPEWMNAYLLFHLEMRNFFGPQAASVNSGFNTPNIQQGALSRISSTQDLLPMIMSRGNSFESLDKLTLKFK
jgi:hypothetical protein